MEEAHRAGVLGAASLMVNGAAATDAVRRAHNLPRLRVGLHLVVIEGRAALPPAEIPDLVDGDGWFGSDQVRRGVRYCFQPTVRRQLAAEIEAQFAAFAATGLRLGHADAHKHMHLHPTIGRLMIQIGRRFGLDRVRVPAEPGAVLKSCGTQPGIGGWALRRWSSVLRGQVRQAGMDTDDQVFGIAWTGRMTKQRLRALAKHLPDGSSEIYSHPAIVQDPSLSALMPGYDPVGEFVALCDPELAANLSHAGVLVTGRD